MTLSRMTNIELVREPNQMLSWWLVHCFLYYVADQPVLRDSQFDKLTKKLLEHWDQVDHPHKELVTLDDLKAGTGFAIKYPKMVEGAAWNLLRMMAEKRETRDSFTPVKAVIVPK
jgi:NAD-dependent DNA ligase